MISAGGGTDGLPRIALNAASCSTNDLVGLKNRNGFSTSQIKPAAWLELTATAAKRPPAIDASAARRIDPSPTLFAGYTSGVVAYCGEECSSIDNYRSLVGVRRLSS